VSDIADKWLTRFAIFARPVPRASVKVGTIIGRLGEPEEIRGVCLVAQQARPGSRIKRAPVQ
jgi:hypothetical protein